MDNREILRYRIEEALDYGFSNHIPLTSDYLAGELLAKLDNTDGVLKQMERRHAAMVIQNRARLYKNMSIDRNDKHDVAMELAIDMLLDPIKHLTPAELRKVYEIQQHNFDKADISNELDAAYDDYAEQYSIDKKPVTAEELDDMACRLRKMLDSDACGVISDTIAIAIADILQERKAEDDK